MDSVPTPLRHCASPLGSYHSWLGVRGELRRSISRRASLDDVISPWRIRPVRAMSGSHRNNLVCDAWEGCGGGPTQPSTLENRLGALGAWHASQPHSEVLWRLQAPTLAVVTKRPSTLTTEGTVSPSQIRCAYSTHASAANLRIVLSIACSPLPRVGLRCWVSPISSMKPCPAAMIVRGSKPE